MFNMDFSKRVVIDSRSLDWVASPMAGVWRKPLAREDAEQGHATSIVRYEAGAHFSAHGHPKGEEILVLAGTFSDESGNYRVGTYFRNPQGFRHAPYSQEGCVLLVKLHQFQSQDDLHVCVDTRAAEWNPNNGNGLVLPLHELNTEKVMLVRCASGRTLHCTATRGGEEIYVIDGELKDSRGSYSAGFWIRTPSKEVRPYHVEKDALVWLKQGHLPED